MSRSQTPDRSPDETTGQAAGKPGEPSASRPTATGPGSGKAKTAAGGSSGRGSSGRGTAGRGAGAGKGGGQGRGAPPRGAGQGRPRPQGRHRLSAAERAALKRHKQRRAIVISLVSVVVVGATVAVVLLRNASQEAAVRNLNVQALPDQGRTHLSAGAKFSKYNSTPPTSGSHDPNPAPCGVSTEPIPNEVQVHDLEHGVVMVQYRPGLDQAQVQALTTLGRSYSSHVIVAPYPDLKTPVAVTAWTKLMPLDRADTGKIRKFIDLYRQLAGPEAGVPCPIG